VRTVDGGVETGRVVVGSSSAWEELWEAARLVRAEEGMLGHIGARVVIAGEAVDRTSSLVVRMEAADMLHVSVMGTCHIRSIDTRTVISRGWRCSRVSGPDPNAPFIPDLRGK
jgi:hypothetical protein